MEIGQNILRTMKYNAKYSRQKPKITYKEAQAYIWGMGAIWYKQDDKDHFLNVKEW